MSRIVRLTLAVVLVGPAWVSAQGSLDEASFEAALRDASTSITPAPDPNAVDANPALGDAAELPPPVAVVVEPQTYALLLAGLGVVAFVSRRYRKV